MQPKILASTLAVVMGVTGLAYAGETRDEHKAQHRTQSSSVSREQTVQMQRALIARNLYQGQADGVWGPKTESALRNFQTQNGLDATGQLNDPTARALGIDAAPTDLRQERQTVSGKDPSLIPAPGAAPAHQAQPVLEDANTNVQLQTLSQEQGREMQQRLQLLGYYRGPVDGKVGEATRAALEAYFQRQAELARQGVISNAAIGMFGTEVDDVPVKGQEAPAKR